MRFSLRGAGLLLVCISLGFTAFLGLAQAPERGLAEGEKSAILPRVMMYHSIREEIYGDYPYLFVRPEDFAEQLDTLHRAGVRFLFADAYAASDEESIILTFDDGYADNYSTLLPLLEQYDACATVFLVTDSIDRPGHLNTAEIRTMAESGRIRFGLHTATHCDLRTLDDAEIRAEMNECLEAFVQAVGYSPAAMAYPYGRFDDRVAGICGEYVSYAYTTDYPPQCTSFGQMSIPRYTVARETTLSEFREMAGIMK